ncbi:hypothetical protein Leryth_026477 [Lithospermum erythrorhizon]|nr:hypothetical protein Leryth_026477 [Lithospermum erythrorhizon]
MLERPWNEVNNFYLYMVNGRVSLSKLCGKETQAIHDDVETLEDKNNSELASIPAKERFGRWARVTFKIVLSYHGSSYDGWQKQPGLNTVQGLVEEALGKFVDDRKAQQLKENNLPLEACVLVAGRTDKGVSAFKQVCSFYTWRTDIREEDVIDALNAVESEKIRVLSVYKVSREFHPNFSAKWRRYMYIFPLTGSQVHKLVIPVEEKTDSCVGGTLLNDDDNAAAGRSKPNTFEVSKVNRLLNQLEGKQLSYKMFARDTKAARNFGPPTECFVFHARAAEASLFDEDANSSNVMCIELVANRFLRRMVRVLVATAIREAAAGAEDDALLRLMDATCRRATAPPAPPDGLCMVDVGYTDFEKGHCFIA